MTPEQKAKYKKIFNDKMTIEVLTNQTSLFEYSEPKENELLLDTMLEIIESEINGLKEEFKLLIANTSATGF